MASTQAVLAGLPTFSPVTPSPGLELLASAALKPASTGLALPGIPLVEVSEASLSMPGPFNPAASLSTKVTKKILSLEYIEMAEVTSVESAGDQGLGRPAPPGRPPVTDISQWVEKFSLMAALIATRFAYQATIVRADRNDEAGRWVAYDRQFRREALARKDLNWSTPDPRLFSEAFTGRAKSIPRCSFCLQEDHTAQRCPQNPDQPWLGWIPYPPQWPSGRQSRRSNEVCRRFNEGRCQLAICRYSHTCRICGEAHPAPSCRQNQHDCGSGPSILPFPTSLFIYSVITCRCSRVDGMLLLANLKVAFL